MDTHVLTAGPAPVSDALRELFALARCLRELLPERAAELRPAGSNRIPLSYLTAIEQARRAQLPYDAIALAALEIPLLVRATGLSRVGLQRPDQYGRVAAPQRWAPIALFDPEAMSPSYQPSPVAVRSFALCVSRAEHERRGDPRVVVVDERGGEAGRPAALSTFLRERLALRFARDLREAEQWREAGRRAAAAGVDLAAEALEVEVVDDQASGAAEPTAARCSHAKFGPGTIVRSLEGGKVEVLFDSGEKRTLLRTFLREVEP